MARPEKTTVDYFPHMISAGKKMFIIEHKHGNDGYAVWYKILEKMAQTSDHYLDLTLDSEKLYLSAKCRVSEEKLITIITDIVKTGAFDAKLWQKGNIIWSQTFLNSLEPVYSRRKLDMKKFEKIYLELLSKCNINLTETQVIAYNNLVNDSKNSVNDDNKRQSKLKQSKVKKSIVIKIGSDEFEKKISEVLSDEYSHVLETALLSFLAGWQKETVLSMMDHEYPFYEFRDVNHLLNALKQLKNKKTTTNKRRYKAL